MSSASAIGRRAGLGGGFLRWLNALPHPPLACEIAATHVAAARWTRGRLGLDGFAVEPLARGALVPSPVEPNLVKADAVQRALDRVLSRLRARGQELALLVPDQVVRVFLLHFDTFPKKAEEAVPLLRWRLKKSVPFDVDETAVSYTLQPPRDGGVDVLAAVARQRIVRQYEVLAEAAGMSPGIVVGSTLATLPLIEDGRPTLLARLTHTTLTSVIVRGDVLAVYRCTEMSAEAAQIEAQALLDEIYPAVAYYQDTWHESVQQVRLAGLGDRFEEFRRVLESGLGCAPKPLGGSAALPERLAGEAGILLDRQLDSLVGWMMNRGA